MLRQGGLRSAPSSPNDALPARRVDALTALRGIAALGVLSYHADVLLGLRDTVAPPLIPYVVALRLTAPFFYCLSAFTLSLASAGENVGVFFMRRFFRIAPLFYLVTLYYVVAYGPYSFTTILSNLLFAYNFDASGDAYHGIAGGAWSLGVEAPFYLAFPLLVRYVTTVGRSLAVLAGFLGVSFAFRLLVAYAAASGLISQAGFVPPASYEDFAWDSIFANLCYFGVGLVAYRCARSLDGAPDAARRTAGLIALALAAIVCLGLPPVHDDFLTSAIPAAHIIGLGLGAATFGFFLVPLRAFVNRFTVFLGEISYSLYLLHFVVLWLIRPQLTALYLLIRNPTLGYLASATALAIATIPLAYFSYRYIELPGIRWGRRLERRLAAHRVSADAPLRGDV